MRNTLTCFPINNQPSFKNNPHSFCQRAQRWVDLPSKGKLSNLNDCKESQSWKDPANTVLNLGRSSQGEKKVKYQLQC